MKKTLAIIFSALICLSTTSCRNKKDNSPENEPTVIETTTASETVTSVVSSSSSKAAGSTASTASKTTVSGSTAAVPESRTDTGEQINLSSSDFSRVNIVHVSSNDSPEHKLHTLDTSKLDFGKSMSPCKAADVRDKYMPSLDEMFGISPDDSRMKEQLSDSYNEYMELIKKNIDVPSEGNISSYTVHGDSVFMFVNYDDLCGSHDYSVFEYNTVSEKLREITHYSGLDDNASIVMANKMYYYNNMLLLEYIDSQTRQISINSIDTATGSVSEFPSDGNKMIWYADDDTLMLYEVTFGNADHDYSSAISISPTTLYRYKNGTFEEVNTDSAYKKQSMLYGDELIKLNNPSRLSSDPLVIETPDYILDTGIKNATFLSAAEDHAIVYTTAVPWSSSNFDVYIFDFVKRECSVITLEDIPMILGVSGKDILYKDINGTNLLDTALGISFILFPDGNAMIEEDSDVKMLTHYTDDSSGLITRMPIYWLE